MNRRQFLAGAAAAAATPLSAAPRSQMALATTCYMTFRRPRDTYEFLEYSHSLGAGGIQASLSSLDPDYIKKLKKRLDETGMFLEVMIGLPRQEGTAAQFEATVAAAKEAGALCVRTACLGGRRYETFKSLPEWQQFVTGSRVGIDRGLRIAEKHRLPFAIENHKDWTADEMVALLKDRSSEYLGVCLDTGNNISLLDDAMDVVNKLLPFTISTHIKDMDVEPYPDGFLLSEVPLGEGYLDIKAIAAAVRKTKAKFTLEMITRNPLKIPCLTDAYWATFPDRDGIYLARMLRLVRDRKRRQSLPTFDELPKASQLQVEEDNVRQCLHYAREQLGL